MTPSQGRRAVRHLLKFGDRMRRHGEADFQDPFDEDGAIGIRVGGRRGMNPQSPVFRAAQRARRGPMGMAP